MTTMMRTIFVWLACVAALVAGATRAEAQYGSRSLGDPAVGEDYHVEASWGLWSPSPEIEVSSESLGIAGTKVNAITDLGLEKKAFQDIRVVLRPSKKFKFRFGYTPIKYEAEATLTRTIVFNGQRYDIGLPVNTAIEWRDWRFGLEYDFIYRDRGYLGFIAEAKYTDLRVDLVSPIASEFSSVKVPVPTVGLVGRVYPVKNLGITGEVSGLKLNIDDNEGTYINVDVYATLSFTKNFGVQGGYRHLSVDYLVDLDEGTLRMKGLWFGGVVRF
jgi:hypothetical protein